MRKLILEMQLSLDGFAADKEGHGSWMIWNWGPDWKWDKEMQDYHTNLIKSCDCVLLSRQMAEEGFIGHWRSVGENISSPQYAFANHTDRSEKVVFSKTLTKEKQIPGGWTNVTIAKGDLKKEVTDLKSRPGKDMIVYGGVSFVSSLIEASLIDEFHFLLNPVILGKGLSIFSSVTSRKNLLLQNVKAFSCGMSVLNYKLGKK